MYQTYLENLTSTTFSLEVGHKTKFEHDTTRTFIGKENPTILR